MKDVNTVTRFDFLSLRQRGFAGRFALVMHEWVGRDAVVRCRSISGHCLVFWNRDGGGVEGCREAGGGRGAKGEPCFTVGARGRRGRETTDRGGWVTGLSKTANRFKNLKKVRQLPN